MGSKPSYLNTGVPIEVADRTLRIYQGGVPGRKLPLTPGLAVKASPPPKPGRDQEPATKVGTIPVYLELRAIKKPESKDNSVVGDKLFRPKHIAVIINSDNSLIKGLKKCLTHSSDNDNSNNSSKHVAMKQFFPASIYTRFYKIQQLLK